MLDPGETSEPSEARAPSTTHAGHGLSHRGGVRFAVRWRDPEVRVVAGVVAAMVAIAIAGPYLPGTVGLAKGSSGPNAASKAAAAGTGTPNTQPTKTTTTPIPPTPEQQAAAVHVPSALAAELRTWNTGSAGRALSQITGDVGTALQSSGTKSYNAMKSACSSLATSISAAGNLAPIPDATMQSQYTAALSGLARAASDCRSAITVTPDGDEYVRTTTNPSVLQLAQTELSSGIKSLAAITIVINAATPHAS
jgi:hypothetical protein